jgi:RimJ/RimL family protein N-acetyltransferase
VDAASPITVPDLRDGDLRLRPPRDTDVARITAICQDAEVQRWTRVPYPYTEAHAQGFVANAADALAEGRGLSLVGVGEDDEVVASIGLSIDPRDFSGELGYWVAPDARRRRLATRGCRLVLRWAFDVAKLGYVALWAAADNEGSNALARSLGFTHEGTSRDAMLLGPTGSRAGQRADAHLWGLRPGELTSA